LCSGTYCKYGLSLADTLIIVEMVCTANAEVQYPQFLLVNYVHAFFYILQRYHSRSVLAVEAFISTPADWGCTRGVPWWSIWKVALCWWRTRRCSWWRWWCVAGLLWRVAKAGLCKWLRVRVRRRLLLWRGRYDLIVRILLSLRWTLWGIPYRCL
jgi:hypothetical protein